MVLREIAESILSFTRDYWKYNYTESIMGFNLLHITESILEIPSVSPPSLPTQSTVEQVVVPQVQTHILRYIQQAERDARIREQCDKFSAVTLQQLNVRPAFRSAELEPFVDSISQLRYSVPGFFLSR